eukprot:491282-Pleurochrysis_carterae.AAC.6
MDKECAQKERERAEKAARLWWPYGRREEREISRCRGGAPRGRPRPDSRVGTRGPLGGREATTAGHTSGRYVVIK